MKYFWKKHLTALAIWTPIVCLGLLIYPIFAEGSFDAITLASLSVLTALGITAMLAIIHLLRIKALDIRIKTPEDLRASKSCEVNTTLSTAEIEHALKTFDRRFQRLTDRLFVLRKMTVFGWTKTELQLTGEAHKVYKIQISAKPTITTAMLDFSENLITVKRLERLFNP